VIAVVVVRDGVLPAGADETTAEAGGRVLLVGEGTMAAAKELHAGREVSCAEVGPYAPAAWSVALASHLATEPVVVLPSSADGRDLAPRLAYALGRPLLAGAVAVDERRVVLARHGGLVAEEHVITGPAVVTLEPGVRGTEPASAAATVSALDVTLPVGERDAEVVEVLPPDPATMDLAEAPRIVAGGAGLGGPDAFVTLARVAVALRASPGASRVAADAGWVPQDRFIGTTGVSVDPDLYVALGISGAVQHVSGLGDPDHIVAVNTDPSAPMMGMADLAIVTDGRALLDELADRLGLGS
jgi:electron transfer flavoprotein alpha subunit